MSVQANSRDGALILVVDDDDDFVFLLNIAWRRAQLPGRLISMRDGFEAVDYLVEAKDTSKPGNQLPDLVLLDAFLDAQFELITGQKMADCIQTQLRLEELRTVMLTGSEPETEALRERKLAADAYHEKPVTLPELVSLARHIYEAHVARCGCQSKAA